MKRIHEVEKRADLEDGTPGIGSKIRIEIDLGNAEMQSGDHVAEALRHCAALVGGVEAGDWAGVGFSIRDANGNTVGKFEVL